MSTVYILTNEAMPGLIKIGMTAQQVEKRMLDLDSTGVPLPFECYYAAKVADMAKVEKALHEAFGDHRIRKSREFFRLDPYRARVILELLSIEEDTPKTEVFQNSDDASALVEAKKMRPRFRFSTARIPTGSTIVFSKDPSLTAQVLDDTRIDYQGAVTSLSASALAILSEMGYKATTVPGTDYWLFEGETLSNRRNRIEASAANDDTDDESLDREKFRGEHGDDYRSTDANEL
jgi:hypothetical protein